MIYLIGGPPRVGKTTLAKKLLKNNLIPYLPTDVIAETLMEVAPQLGITDQLAHIQRGENFAPYLKGLVKYAYDEVGDYVIEGEVILPKTVAAIPQELPVKAVFLGFSKITLDQLHQTGGDNQWIKDLSPEEQEEFPKKIIEISSYLQEEAIKYNLKYFDLSERYEEQLENAYQYLRGK